MHRIADHLIFPTGSPIVLIYTVHRYCDRTFCMNKYFTETVLSAKHFLFGCIRSFSHVPESSLDLIVSVTVVCVNHS